MNGNIVQAFCHYMRASSTELSRHFLIRHSDSLRNCAVSVAFGETDDEI